jgi:hypothetical protein|tara:strand:- start:195 stop:368 length:174 start_codon:yes stop_codon:yes gene_type:complete
MHDLYDLLAGGHPLQHGLAKGPILNTLKKFTRNPEIDVGLEQYSPNLTQPVSNHGLS